MNKKILVVLVVILLLVLGGWFFVSSKKVSDKKPGIQNTESTSLKDILLGGNSQTCTFENSGSKGTIYVSGGKVRGDFEVNVEGQSSKSHMLVMDSTSYIWTDGQATGFKMNFDPNTKPTDNNTAQGLDPTANNNYKCSKWVSDDTKFTLPATVNFNALELPTNPGDPPVPVGAGTTSQCSYCNALTGDDKTQCLTALKCN